MFWWFKCGEQFIGYESRMTVANEHSLPIYESHGSLARRDRARRAVRCEAALQERQRALDEELTGEGWTGPHGWIL
jgi:hypothetical protein